MSIQPLDLQTLFAHINHVGKDQAAIKDVLASQQAAHASELVKDKKHQDESVNQISEADEDNQKIHTDKENNNFEKPDGEAGKEDAKAESERKRVSVFKDPDLGMNIDISG